jgi:putative ABC transport system permease protein
MSALWQDFRYSLRTFSNNPGSTIVAITVLGLGIGANAAIFSVTNATLFRALPYPNPGRLVFVWENKLSKGMHQEHVSAGDFNDLRAQNQVLDDMGAIRSQSSVLISGETPERIETAAVSPAVFKLLGMKPILGRAFAPDEDQPDKNHVALLSAGLWERHFGRDPNVLGTKVLVDGSSFTVVGVAPAGFRIPTSSSELWIPYTPKTEELAAAKRGESRFLDVLASLRLGTTLARAQTELQAIAATFARQYPDSNEGYSVELVPLREQLIGNVRPTLWMLMAAVLAVLLIACVNVAHLLLARAGSREKEIAVRTALGANPARLVRQLLTESIVLALAAGLFGLLLAYWGSWLLARLAPLGLPQTRDMTAGELTLDWRVLAFTLGVSLLTGVAFGLAPALSSARSNLNLILRSGGRGGAGSRTRSRLRDILMVCEVASSAALLVGAGLLIRSFAHLEEVNPGFRADHLLTMQLSLPPLRYPGAKIGAFYEQLLQRVDRLPGVEQAGICRFLPLTGNDASLNFQIEGQPRLSDADQPRAKFRSASAGYFEAMRIPLLRGRLFDDRDTQGTPKVVIINQTAARRYWPGENPIGKRILSGVDEDQHSWSTIVGVVGDVKYSGLDSITSPETYYHYRQIPPDEMNVAEGTMALAIRTDGDPAAVASAVRGELHSLDPAQPLFNVRTMDQLVDNSVAQPRFRTFLVSAFAALALVLVALGLYGVVAYSVSQRVTELAIRVALGAEPAGILQLVLSRVAGLTLLGLVIGVAISFAGRGILARFLFGVSPADPLTLLLVCLLILSVAVGASLAPALRSTRVDPAIVLRSE